MSEDPILRLKEILMQASDSPQRLIGFFHSYSWHGKTTGEHTEKLASTVDSDKFLS